MTRRRRPRTSEERLVAAVGSVARGVVGGRIRNVRQAAPLERNTGSTETGGAFDPNANPIVIGLGATPGADPVYEIVIGAGATATTNGDIVIGHSATSNGGTAVGENSTSNSGAVAVGDGSEATGSDSVAIGLFATASTDDAIAIGNSAQAIAASAIAVGKSAAAVAYGVAIGELAATQASDGVAIGHFTNIHLSATRGTAIGYGAGVGGFHSHSTAIGAEANTTAANQVMLGTAADTVKLPGNFDVAALPTADPGISGLVWNNGGTLVVSP